MRDAPERSTNHIPAFLTAPHYVLGEIEEDHTAIVNLKERIAEFRILSRPDFWGWGAIRRTDQEVATLAVQTGQASLRAAGLDPAAVDGLVLCSSSFPDGTGNHGLFVQAVMSGLGLEDVDVVGITLNSCANLMAGLRAAYAMVASGQCRRVLLITADRVTDERIRMEKFALFSDGAASGVVTAEPGGFEIVSGAAAYRVSDLDWSGEISPDLARTVNDRLLKPAGITLPDVAGLLHANIFRPVIVLKEMQAGFTADQLYTDNIPRTGHCFAADPFVNLVDRIAAGGISDDRHYMLASSVPGLRIGALLRKVPDHT